MKLEFTGYKIITDDKQFIVQKKRIVEAGRLTKAENIGKEHFQDVAYYTSFDSALQFLARSIVLDNDDLLVIKEKLNLLESEIKEFCDMLKIVGVK